MLRRLPAHTACGLANVGAAALLLVACGREPTVPFADGGSGRGLGLDAVWQARGFQGVSIPATDASHVYVRDAGRVVRAFDKRTGAPRWQRPLPADAGSPNARLATTAGLVLVGGDATLLALDAATGADRWRFRGDATESAGALVPAVDDSTVYLAALGSARVYAVDARTGQTRWATAVAPPVSGAPLTQVSASAYYPVLDDERVFVTYIRFHARDQQPGNQGGVAAVSRRTGELLWRYEFVRRDPPLNVGTGIGNPPAVRGGVVVAASGDGWTYGLDAGTGAERWRLPSLPRPAESLGQICFVGAGAGVALVGCGDGQFRAVDLQTGAMTWQRAVFDVGSPWSITTDGPHAFVGFFGQSLVAFDLRSGAERWKFQASDLVGFMHGAWPDGDLVYAAGNPGLVALRR